MITTRHARPSNRRDAETQRRAQRIETPKSKQSTVSKEEATDSRRKYQSTHEEFIRHRDELSRLLLSDYIDNALAQLCV